MTVRALDPVRLDGGRYLAICEVGDPDGDVAFYFHGTGSSRLEVEHFATAATAHGIRLVCWDRPGSGHSPLQEGRRLLSVVDDARAVAQALGVERVAVAGFSGGGCHVLALVATATDLVTRGVVINPAPPAADVHVAELPSPMDRLVATARDQPARLAVIIRGLELVGGRFGEVLRLRSLPASDRAVVTGPARALFESVALEGARQAHAYGNEALMFWREPWGFALDSFPVPLDVFSGEEDPFRAFCRRLEAAGATFHGYAGGHNSCFVPDVEAQIVAALTAPPPPLVAVRFPNPAV